jgi:hypothetical protein
MVQRHHTGGKISGGSRVWWLDSEHHTAGNARKEHDMSDEQDRVELDKDEDFEGHKLESKIEPKVESDFEGHRMMDAKVEPKFEERVQE